MIEESSALFSDVIEPPVRPAIDGCNGDNGNVYENLLELKKRATNFESNARSVFLMRHGERVDYTFGNWISNCFDETGKYTRIDLNMPKTLPMRSDGNIGYLKDSPITNIGIMQATLTGESFKEKNIEIDHVYCSPSFRCIQTCDGFLRGLGKRDQLKIKIEPGLFEWTFWYNEGIPSWLSKDELLQGGFNIDENYTPFVREKELEELEETCYQYYSRNAFITRSTLSAHPSGNILLVGHAPTLDTCSYELTGRKPKSKNDMINLLFKIPYCAITEVTNISGQWKIVEPPSLPVTHSNNNGFDFKLISE